MRLFSPYFRVVLFAVCVLVGSVQAQGLFGASGDGYEMPTRFVRVDVYSAGSYYGYSDPMFWVALSLRGLKGTVIFDHLRVGLAPADMYIMPGFQEAPGWTGVTFLPMHIGYTLYSRPSKCWFFYGAVPDIYAEASAAFLRDDFRFSPSVRLATCAEIDYIGLGIGVEGGWVNLENTDEVRHRVSLFYLGLQFRVLTLRIGF